MGNVWKFLLLAVGCIIVIALISLSLRVSKKGEADTEKNLGQYNRIASDAQDADLKLYDNIEVKGSEIVELIKEYNDHDYLSVVVDTNGGSSTAYINPCVATGITMPVTNTGIDYSALPSSKSSGNYINEAGIFRSLVYYDSNDVLACIWFTQQ